MSNSAKPDTDPLIPRRGFIEISAEVAKTSPSLLLRIQSDMAVNDTSINHVTDTFRLYGKSLQFDPIESHQIAPAYDWHLAPNGAVKYSRK